MAKKKTEQIMTTATLDNPRTIVTLPQKTVTIVFYPRPTAMVKDPDHILYGGLGPNTGKTFQLPLARTGAYMNPFPSSEMQELLERKLGLPEDGLSPARTQNNFFDNYTITLNKSNAPLTLSDPHQYLEFLVSLAQKDFVAPNEATVHNKASYQWYVQDEAVEAERKVLKLSKIAEAWKEFGKIETSVGKLRQIVIEKKGKSNLPTSANSLQWLVGTVGEYIEDDPSVFLNLVKDPNLSVKVDIYEAVALGAIKKKGNFYYNEDETPLSIPGEQNDLMGVISFVTQPENSDYYATLKQRIQNAK